MDSSNTTCFYSYNSRGHALEKLKFMKNLISLSGCEITIFALQEHFLLRNNLKTLDKFFDTSSVLSVPAFKNFSVHNRGRPQGGLSIIIPKVLRKHTKIIKCDSWRIQPILLNFNSVEYLIINSYFPTDKREENLSSPELEETLGCISSIISTNESRHICLLGDLNSDFLRNTAHVKAVRNFLDTTKLLKCIDIFSGEFSHTFERENVTYTSLVDHITFSPEMHKLVLDSGVIHSPENQSDHECVFAKVRLRGPSENTASFSSDNIAKSKQCWDKATVDQKLEYNDVLFRKLMELHLPDSLHSCTDVNCKNDRHKSSIDNYCKQLLECISESGHETIPQFVPKPPTNKKNKKSIPGWNDYIRSFQEQAQFWYSIWLSAGKPINTELHNIMKRTRNKFHFQVRKCRRVETYIRNNKLIENRFESDMDLFSEIKKARKTQSDESTIIDGKSGEKIPDAFGKVYNDLYNKIDDRDNLKEINLRISDNINNDSLKEVNKIDQSLIREALHKINPGKSDPVWDFSSDFLKNGPDLLLDHLAVLIQGFFIHGHISEILLLASLVPIVKDKLGDLSSSKNYRSIAISSLILKVLDWVIILLYGENLKLDGYQFGYQEKCSPSLCSWLTLETISMYIRHGSTVFGCLMDCSKAFDTIQQSLLFNKMIERKIPLIIVRLLINMYQKQTLDVRWKNKFSKEFPMSNGTKQGAVLSPILFCFYMNDLFKELRENRSGCYIGNYYSGCFGYADDLL